MLRLVANYGQTYIYIYIPKEIHGFFPSKSDFMSKTLSKKMMYNTPPKSHLQPYFTPSTHRLCRGQRTPNVDEEMLKVPRDQGLRCHWKRNEGSLG